MNCIDWTEEQVDCRAGKEEKWKLGAERWSSVEKRLGGKAEVESGLKGLDRVSAALISAPGT